MWRFRDSQNSGCHNGRCQGLKTVGRMDPQKITLQSTSEWLVALWSQFLPTQHAMLWRRMKGTNSFLGGSHLFLLLHSRIFHSHREHHIFSKLILIAEKKGNWRFPVKNSYFVKSISTLKFTLLGFFFCFLFLHLILLCIIKKNVVRRFWHLHPFNVSFGIILSHSNNLANLCMLIDY